MVASAFTFWGSQWTHLISFLYLTNHTWKKKSLDQFKLFGSVIELERTEWCYTTWHSETNVLYFQEVICTFLQEHVASGLLALTLRRMGGECDCTLTFPTTPPGHVCNCSLIPCSSVGLRWGLNSMSLGRLVEQESTYAAAEKLSSTLSEEVLLWLHWSYSPTSILLQESLINSLVFWGELHWDKHWLVILTLSEKWQLCLNPVPVPREKIWQWWFTWWCRRTWAGRLWSKQETASDRHLLLLE